MSKGKKVTIGYRYRLGFHLVLCQGGADSIIKIRYEDRVAWTGSVTGNQTLTINQPNLFGGDKKQGGLQGDIDFMFGGESQPVNDYLVYQSNKTVVPTYLSQYDFLGGASGWTAASGGGNADIVANGGIAVPAYRGVVSLVFKKFMYGALTPYLKPFRVTVRRIPKTLGVTNATITIDGRQNANPAHMIYDILTNKQWGQGLEAGDINTASFTTAAATLAAEGFGLSLLWKQESTADDFINLIMSHISATLYPDPSTGQYTLKLMRADYTLSALPTLDETNILSLRSYQRVSTNDLTNELTVEYYDPDNEQEAKVTVQNLAALRSVGKVVRRVIQYPGIRSGDLAARVAQRDLLAFSTPLAKLSIEVNLAAWDLRPGDVFKFSWNKLGITSIVFRVIEIEYGSLRDNKISITAVEDIFAVSASSYIGTQAPIWQTVPNSLADITTYKMFDAPYYTLIQYFGEEYATTLADNRNYVTVVAPRANGLWSDFKLHELVSGSYVERDAGTFSPFVTITGAMTEVVTSVPYTGYFDTDLVTVGSIGVIDNEWVAVDAINTTTKTLTLKRGVLDSIPAAHTAGTLMYLYGDNYLLDEDTDRYGAETVTYKFQPSTGGDELALANATARGYTLNGRQQRPYPPGNVTINSLYFPTTVDEFATVNWAHRDRTLQTATPIAWTNGNIGPETGVTYTLTFYVGASATVVHQATALSVTTYFADDSKLGEYEDLRLEIKSVRNAIDNFQTFTHRFTRLVSRADYGLRVISDSPIGYWKLSDPLGGTTLNNASLNTLTGTSSNVTFQTASLLAPGGTNKAATFNGTSSYGAVTYAATLAPTAAVTVEAWVKFNSFTNANYAIVSKTENGGYALRITTDAPVASKSLSFWVRRNAAYGVASYPVTSLATGVVYHVVGTFDGRYTRLYVDGVLVATNDAGAIYAITYSSSNALIIGAEAGTAAVPTGEYFDGTIDDVSVYGSAIATDPILARYKSGVNRISYREDLFRDKVVLLMHMSGVAGAANFYEVSGKTVTAVGTAVHSATQTKFGSTSAFFDGTGDYLRLSPSTDYAFGTGDFTVECWAYQTNTLPWRITNRLEWSAANGTWSLYVTPTGVSFTQVIGGEPGAVATGLTSVQNQWAHYAASRTKGFVRVYRNGVLVASAIDTTNYNSSAYDLKIGVSDSTNAIAGYIDEVRITKAARYSGVSFNLPVEQLPERVALDESQDAFWGDKTALLMHFDSGFSDIKGKTITQFGSPSISSTQSKFGGFSGFLNGSTSYLDVTGGSLDLPNSDLTFEAWVWPQSDPVSPAVTRTLLNIFGATKGFHVHLVKSNTGVCTLSVDNGLVGTTSGTVTFPIQTWTHIAVTRFGNTITGYVNGEKSLQHTAQSYSTPTVWRIGQFWDSTEASTNRFHGYIDELRITRACRYFSNFAPRKSAYPDTGISQFQSLSASATTTALPSGQYADPDWPYVQLLVQPAGADGSTSFTDSSKNNFAISLEGSAQVDTGVLIGGQPTILCDGAGDLIKAPLNSLLNPGAADFTIEFWVRPSTTAGIQTILSKRALGGNYCEIVVLINGGTFALYASTSGAGWISDLTSGTVVANTTYHVACERFGSTIKLYLNGVETGSIAVTGALFNVGAPWNYGSDSTQNGVNGNLGPVRMQFGKARYQGAFTPPTIPFSFRAKATVNGV